MAAHGYPDTPRKNDHITGIPADTSDCFTFHAGTRQADGKLLTNGGRVLCVVGLGDNVKLAQKHVYDTVERIHFDGAQYRRDIGWRAKHHG
jgi:phosphoribosylamine--glycine ligase